MTGTDLELFSWKYLYMPADADRGEISEKSFSAELSTRTGSETILTNDLTDREALRRLTDPLFDEPGWDAAPDGAKPDEKLFAALVEKERRLIAEWQASTPIWFHLLWVKIPDALARKYVVVDLKIGRDTQWLREVPPAHTNFSELTGEERTRYFGEVPANMFAESAPMRVMGWETLFRGASITLKVRRL